MTPARNGGQGPTRGSDAAGNLVVDLDGVLYLENEPIPGAGAALSALEARGYRVILVTNNSTRHRSEVAARVSTITGYPAQPDLTVTSGLATARMLVGDVERAYVVGEPGLTRTLQDEGIECTGDWRRADAVVVGLDRSVDYQRLREASLAVRAGARFVASNTDPTFPTPEGLWPGGGAIVAAIEATAGVTPEVAGKPHEPTRAMTRALLGPGPTWVIGDRADTDLAMGVLEGWGRVLVLTGSTGSAEEVPVEERPELVLASIAELPDVLH
jgi:4-nitrophenyl phosphatase